MKIQLEITSKTNKNIEGNERKKIRNERGLTEQMKKWTEGAVDRIYSAVLPTTSPTAIKKNYFKLFCRWSFENPSINFEFRTIVFNYPPYFSPSVGILTRSEMYLMHRLLEFTQVVGDFVGNIDPPTTYRRTGIRLQIHRWLWVAFVVIIFQLSMKCRRTVVRLQSRR